MEVVIGLAIGAVLMGTAAFAVTTMLRTNLTSERSQFASRFAQSLSDNVRSYAVGNWDSLYGLTKATSTHYFLNASGTTFFVVQGEEGMLDGDVTDGLVGHWKFDEVETTASTTTYDATGNGYHGTLTNNPTRATSTCKVSNCLSFDGTNDYVTSGVTELPGAGDGITIAAWVYPLARQLAGDRDMIFRQNGYLTLTASGTISAYFYGLASEGYHNGASVIPLNEWTHIATTYDSASGAIGFYVNGVLDAATSTTGSLTSAQTGFVIGGEPCCSRYFNGRIDDVRVYNRALSADEARQLWNSGAYERFFTIENVCRTNDASSTIASTAPCSGTLEDNSTQWITSYAQWTTGAGTSELTLPTVVARWQNAVFHQTDWSGGAADEGAVVEPTSNFSSSTNASTTGGVIQIQNLSQE